MILNINGVSDEKVREWNARLLEILGSDERVMRYLRSPCGGLVIAAAKHGYCLRIVRGEGGTRTRLLNPN